MYEFRLSFRSDYSNRLSLTDLDIQSTDIKKMSIFFGFQLRKKQMNKYSIKLNKKITCSSIFNGLLFRGHLCLIGRVADGLVRDLVRLAVAM